MNKTIAFIGAGNMGGAIIRAACRAIDPGQVVIYDTMADKAAALAEETGCTVAASGGEAAGQAHYVMLCVKPQYYIGVLRDLLPALKEAAGRGEKQTLVSIVTGGKLATLSGVLAEAELELPIVRIMPNTPAAIGKGVLLMAPADSVAPEDFEQLKGVLSQCGLLERVDEHMLDMATPVSGCTPAFVYLFIEALADGAVQVGVPRDKAMMYAAQTVLGSAAMVLESGQHPGALKDAVCSPGGSTIAGVEKLEECGFRYAAAQAIVAAYRRNCELG